MISPRVEFTLRPPPTGTLALLVRASPGAVAEADGAGVADADGTGMTAAAIEATRKPFATLSGTA